MATTFNLGALDGENGFRIRGLDFSIGTPSTTVAGAGDINGDGVADILIGSNHRLASSSGVERSNESYVVFGALTFEQFVDVTDLDGTNGFHIRGSGISVSGAGDINGDGVDDIVVGRSDGFFVGGQDPGDVHVIYGTRDEGGPVFDPTALDGANGFAIRGVGPEERIGLGVSGAGDINGDGYADIAIAGLGFSSGRPRDETGKANYVVFGGGDIDGVDLASLDGVNGFRIERSRGESLSLDAVASAGDVNGDGVDDLVIGAGSADTGSSEVDAGETYVVFGSRAGFGASFDLSSLDGSNGFRLEGSLGGQSGYSVAGAGDFNGDGIDDLLIGAPFRGGVGQEVGATFLVFGSSSGFDATIDLSELDGENGFSVQGDRSFDRSGFSVAAAGDVNGDGLDDILIGAPGGDRDSVRDGQAVGETYVLFGSRADLGSRVRLAELDDAAGIRFDGVDDLDESGKIVAGAGDVNGDGIDDILIGTSDDRPNELSSAGETYVVFGDQNWGAPPSRNERDFNGDGTDDFLWRNANSGEVVLWAMAQGSPSYESVGRASADWLSEGVGDFNGDATADILWRNAESGRVVLWEMQNGAPSFRDAGRATFDWSVVGTGDFNGDGVDDIAWRNGDNGAVSLWRMQDGAPSYGQAGRASANWSAEGTGDFDGDGTADLLWRNATTGEVVVWEMDDGLPSFQRAGRATSDWSVEGTGDFNADGVDDIIWRNEISGAVVVWRMGDGAPSYHRAGSATDDWSVVATGDFNADGIEDIAWRNANSGDVVNWEMTDGRPRFDKLGAAGPEWQVVGELTDDPTV